MNNSKLAIESVGISLESQIQNSDSLKEKEVKLTQWIDAIQKIHATNEWRSLKEVFDPLSESLHKQILAEAKKPNPDTNKLNRLSGELRWAERYADLQKLAGEFRVELTNIRLKLYGKT